MELFHYLHRGVPHVFPYLVAAILTLSLWRRWPTVALFGAISIVLLMWCQILVL